VAQRAVWEVTQSDFWNAGTLTTAGNLVFQGRSDGRFFAYDARTGATLWERDLGLGISAPPITYRLDGVQYVSLLVGFGGGVAGQVTDYEADLGWSYGVHTRRLVNFAIDANAKLPKQPPPHAVTPLVDIGFELNNEAAARGQTVWNENGCGNCHGKNVVAAGMAPDLRASAVPLSDEAFTSVVRDGVRSARMMPANPLLSDRELKDLMHFVRQQAHSFVDTP
jgi:quinohemoprotein ethanol dehydrogenase